MPQKQGKERTCRRSPLLIVMGRQQVPYHRRAGPCAALYLHQGHKSLISHLKHKQEHFLIRIPDKLDQDTGEGMAIG